jgi:hypothetical protein
MILWFCILAELSEEQQADWLLIHNIRIVYIWLTKRNYLNIHDIKLLVLVMIYIVSVRITFRVVTKSMFLQNTSNHPQATCHDNSEEYNLNLHHHKNPKV